MSMIIKSETGREAELNSMVSSIVKQLGMNEEMSVESALNVLNTGLVRLVAHGNSNEYRQLKEVINEVSTWSGNVHVDL